MLYFELNFELEKTVFWLFYLVISLWQVGHISKNSFMLAINPTSKIVSLLLFFLPTMLPDTCRPSPLLAQSTISSTTDHQQNRLPALPQHQIAITKTPVAALAYYLLSVYRHYRPPTAATSTTIKPPVVPPTLVVTVALSLHQTATIKPFFWSLKEVNASFHPDLFLSFMIVLVIIYVYMIKINDSM